MRFLLLGNHPDGVALTRALVRQGEHQLAVYTGPPDLAKAFQGLGWEFEVYRDVETALALSAVEFVIVADALHHRPAMLRRALQSEKHVLCVHPADLAPDIAYECMMILQDTRKHLMPMLAERLAPGLAWLKSKLLTNAIGALQSIEIVQHFRECPYDPQDKSSISLAWERHPLLVVWDALRSLGGEVQDVSTVALQAEELLPHQQVTLTGRLERGALFQVLLRPVEKADEIHIVLRGEIGQLTLHAPHGWFAPSIGALESKTHPEEKEEIPGMSREDALVQIASSWNGQVHSPLSWTDGTRCLELFDAARRSMKKRRLVPMDYEAMSETANFKSFMTAFGCFMLLAVIVLFFMIPTLPWAKYLIPVLLAIFLGMQTFAWLIREPLKPGAGTPTDDEGPGD